MEAISTNVNTLEYSGFNTKTGREVRKLNTGTVYLPLIETLLTDPSTKMTTLEEAIRLTDQTYQPYTVIKCNRQLYYMQEDIK